MEAWSGLNLLVTGCAGFISSRVASQLLDLGSTVVGVDSLADPHGNPLQRWRLDPLLRHPRFTFKHLGIAVSDQLRPLFQSESRGDQVWGIINRGAVAGVRVSTGATISRLGPDAYGKSVGD